MERTGERQQEHYCWVKIVAPPDDGDSAPASSRSLSPALRRAFDSAHFLKKMADGDSPPGSDRPPPVPAPPPPVSPNSPPPPPHIQRLAGTALASPAWQVERSQKPTGDFGMEVAGMGIDRDAAQRWIDSEEGRRWRAGAVGLNFVLFKGPRND